MTATVHRPRHAAGASAAPPGGPLPAGRPDARRPDTDRSHAGTRPAPAPPGGRDRYIDSLRVLALGRVVAYHLFGWIWLPAIFPSMGVMFALAGSLVAASLDRRAGQAGTVIRKRMKRLLPPLWAFGLVVVPIMAVQGWSTAEDTTPLSWDTAIAWVVPYITPPSNAEGYEWVLPLWYISTYLWFVLLSPALLWLYRRWPMPTLLAPLALVLLIANDVIETSGPGGDAVTELATFGACWIVGFAHHDGRIRRIALWKIIAVAGACLAFGLNWAFTYPSLDSGVDISDIPVADAFFGFGFVLLLLRLYVDMSWMSRVPVLDRLVGAVNRRAMTIYLWGNVAIFVALALLDSTSATQRFTTDDPLSHVVAFATTWLVIGGFVLAFGWVEDLAAGRRLRWWPQRLRRVARGTGARRAATATERLASPAAP